MRLDILPDYHSKYKNVADNFEKVWKFNRFFSNNWITILSFILMFVFLALAVDSKNNNYDFDYDVYISLSTGFLISLIISGINASHKRRLRNKKAEFNQILYQFELLKKSYNEINEYMMKEDIKNNKDFVSEFCEFNNSLNDFLDNTSKILSLQSSSIYQWFKDFEKEIFDYSSSIVQKDFDKTIMDQTTDEDIAVLQKYVIQFRYWVNHFEFDIMNLKHYYGKDIDKMKDKSL
ncbi:hypothetical protein [Acholeplasma laidlawii]|uniref:hypothetical protein n=1 Tax=Acholeplasma laidlawii TaxID=2148 RepID=UPI0015A84DDA|nr:hypothetical protein [Acholeplasma laidlawii]